MRACLASIAAVLLLAPALRAERLQRPARGERAQQCDALANDAKYACHSKAKIVGSHAVPANLYYGWNAGAGFPVSDTDPPSYDKLLNGLDQCAWFHDRGAWRWNPRTHLCETFAMCSNAIGLWKCVSNYQPETPEEERAKTAMLHSIGRVSETCIRKLYKDYGFEFARDVHGSQWLSDKSERELTDAFKRCKPGMAIPGFPYAREIEAAHAKKR
jgi:hypothetical protein